MTMIIEHDTDFVRLSALNALALAQGQLNHLNRMRAAAGNDINVAAYTAAISLVTSAIAAFDDGDYPRALALMDAAEEELSSHP